MRRVLLALIVCTSLVPLAGAHAVPADFGVDPFVEPLGFETERATTLRFDYRCSGMSDARSEANMTVDFSVAEAPEWARLRIEPARLELPTCEGIGQATARIFATAVQNVSMSAGPATIRAAWSTSGFVLNETADVALAPPFVPAFEMTVGETEKAARPQDVVAFLVTFESHATGPLKLDFELVEKGDGLQVPVPNPITLQGPGGAIRSADVPFVAQTPYRNGPNDVTETFTYRVTAKHPIDPTLRGEPQLLTFTVHTKGFYMPGPGLAVVALAAVAAALAFTRASGRP